MRRVLGVAGAIAAVSGVIALDLGWPRQSAGIPPRFFNALVDTFVAPVQPAAADAELPGPEVYRRFANSLFRAYVAKPTEYQSVAFYCEDAAALSKSYAPNEAWLGMIAQCFAHAELADDEGSRLAACEYAIGARRYLAKARPKAHEAAGVQGALAEAEELIAKLEC